MACHTRGMDGHGVWIPFRRGVGMPSSRSRSGVSGSGDLRSAQNGHFGAPFGPKWDPFWGHPHPLLAPFWTPSGTPYPLSHRGRVPRGVLIPMCHVTKCSPHPFILTPTR